MLKSSLFRMLIALLCLPVLAAADDTEKQDSKQAKKSPAVVAVFPLRGSITESPGADDIPFGPVNSESMLSLTRRLALAEKDDQVKAVVFLMDGASLSVAKTEELRPYLKRMRAAGKEVHLHADALSMGTYTFAAGASEISVVPTGDIWIQGLYGESPYLRGLFNLVGITPDFLTCGDYKAAAEMFVRYGPSPAAQENTDWLLDGMFEVMVELIADGRGVSNKQVRRWIDQGLYSSETAKAAGIIDSCQHRGEFLAALKERYGEDAKLDTKYGKKKPIEIDLSSPFGLLKLYAELLAPKSSSTSKKDSVAIIYVEGPIMPGSGDSLPFPLGAGASAYSTPIRRALERAAADDSVKAVVLRVDSPGGSAVASEIILAATKRVKAKKPLVVSMGSVAGSGGYYVACGSDTIFADASTITGSIGVVSGKLATENMWTRFGVSWHADQRGKNAGILASGKGFTAEQRQQMQSWMDDIYGVFKGHVTAIRGEQLTKNIDELAGGRVYTGRQALDLGLVDKIGGLRDAIAFAAKEAKLEKYEVRVLPKKKSFVEVLLGEDEDADQLLTVRAAGTVEQMLSQHPAFRAALLQLQKLEPQRYRAISTSFRYLDIMQQEKAILATPIFVIE